MSLILKKFMKSLNCNFELLAKKFLANGKIFGLISDKARIPKYDAL
jgi:hypothetical protein